MRILKHKKLRICIMSISLIFMGHTLFARNYHINSKRFIAIAMGNFYSNMRFLGFPDDFFTSSHTPTSKNNEPQRIYIIQSELENDTDKNSPQTSHNNTDLNSNGINLWPLLGEDNTKHKSRNKKRKDRYHQYNPATDKQKITFDDVKGQKEAIREIGEVVDFLKHPEKYKALGAEIPRGILLEGPPGCGKTMLAKAVAGEAGCPFISACGSQFINKYVGTGADNVRKLFEQARAQAKQHKAAIVFIDEIDALKARGEKTNEEYHHTLNALLDQLDGFNKDSNIIVIAATNFVKALDPALVRPGRFDRTIKVGFPTRQGRLEIIDLYAKKILLDPSISINKLAKEFAQRTTTFSGAELKKLVNEAALTACRHKASHVTTNHFEEAYDKITLGLANNLDRTPEQLRRTACHEAGHTLLKVLTDQPIAKVSILSKGDALGVTFEKEKYENTSEYKKEELLAKIMALQGGYLSEKIICNCSRPGASDDIKQAYNIARAMVKEFGMGRNELEGLRYSNDMSAAWKEKFDDEIANTLRTCSGKAEKLLRDNKDKLNRLIETLLKKETLNEAEIRAACANS